MKAEDPNKKIAELEKLVIRLQKEVRSLQQSLAYMERENNRRKSEITTLSHLKSK